MSEMQQEAMAVLSEIWQLSPEVRLGQFDGASRFSVGDVSGQGPWLR